MDNRGLFYLTPSSNHLFRSNYGKRLGHLAQLARMSDIQTIRSVFNSLENSKDMDSLRTLLTTKFEMAYTDENNNKVLHGDTLLQIAWRTRNIRLFDIVKSYCDKIDPKLAATQILNDFQGKQSCWLKHYAIKMHTAGLLCSNGLPGPREDEAKRFWQQEVGSLTHQLYQDMAWVLHLHCNKILSYSNFNFDFDFDASFDIGPTELTKTQNFINQAFNGGFLGSKWAPTEDIYGESRPSDICYLVYFEYAEWSGDSYNKLLNKVKCAEEARLQALQKEMQYEDRKTPSCLLTR